MVSFLLFFPFINLIALGFFGFSIGRNGARFITKTCFLFLAFFLLFLWIIWVSYKPAAGSYLTSIDAIIVPWFNINTLRVDWAFLCDSLTLIMLTIVIGVSFVVHLYSLHYMAVDPHLCRFISFLSLFTFFMLILITSANFLQLFLGWEGVGICSFLLITFWYTRGQANKAALKAMVVNRVGDVGILLALVALFNIFLTLDYSALFPAVYYLQNSQFNIFSITCTSYTFITIFFLIGVAGKSAQFGLHTWLPDAMEGPSPVSALIHAATMVTAGIFLVVRSSILFEYTPTGLFWVVILGSITTIFGGSCATAQYDIKKVIAYSTCSQLGYMLLCCGFSEYAVGLYHLVNHAFFKALLFLTAGNVIHSLYGEQDIRKMGGLSKILPATYSLFLLGSLSLMGIPFLSGFFSKDFIIEVVVGSYSFVSGFSQLIITFVTALTAFYSTRLLILVFLGLPRGYRQVYQTSHESSNPMLRPLLLLAFGAIFSGYFWEDLFIGFGTDFYSNSIFLHPQHINIIYPEFIFFTLKNIPLLSVIFGVGLGGMIYLLSHWSAPRFFTPLQYQLLYFLNNKWFIDKLYNNIFVVQILKNSYTYGVKLLDRGVLEWLGPTGLYWLVSKGNKKFLFAQTGHIVHYAALIFLGWLTILILLFF